MWNGGLELFLTSEAGHAKKRDGSWCRWRLTAKMLILLEINFPVKIFLKWKHIGVSVAAADLFYRLSSLNCVLHFLR